MYDSERFFTVTGEHVSGTPTTIESRAEELEKLHAEIFGEGTPNDGSNEPQPPTFCNASQTLSDEEILQKARSAKNGEKFRSLFDYGRIEEYPSHSEADLALVALLSYWTDDARRIDRLFRQSALFREKWDEKRGSRTYGEQTIQKALRSSFREPLRQMRLLAHAQSWPGQTGVTQRALLSAFFDQIEEHGKFTLDASRRDLMLKARIAHPVTFRKARDGLIKLGWLLMEPFLERKVSDAQRYTVKFPGGLRSAVNHTNTRVGYAHLNSINMSEHVWFRSEREISDIPDLWRRNELGDNGRRIYALLNTLPLPVKSIVQAVNVPESTTRRKLAKMKALGLAVNGKEGWSRGPADPYAAATTVKSAGADARQKAQYEKERHDFARLVRCSSLGGVEPGNDHTLPQKNHAKIEEEENLLRQAAQFRPFRKKR
jgi:hypothetical protein